MVMLFQSFGAPRKRPSNLGAGVSAGALLLGQGLAVLISDSPCRMLMQPLDGSEGRVFDLALSGVQDLALLSKDVALVLERDHVLSALLDLNENVKVRQVTR